MSSRCTYARRFRTYFALSTRQFASPIPCAERVIRMAVCEGARRREIPRISRS